MNVRCQASGPNDLVVDWYHNGAKLTDGDRISTQNQFNFYDLLIQSVTFSDSGVYSCNLTFGSHFDFASVEATVGGRYKKRHLIIIFMI